MKILLLSLASSLALPKTIPMLGQFSVITGLPTKTTVNPLLPLLDNTAIPKEESSPKCQAVKLVKVSADYNINNQSVVKDDRLNMFLKGVLTEKGNVIIKAAREYNICPIFLGAVIMHESDCGRSKFARERNNIAGIYLKGKYHTFDTVDDCIKYTAKLLGGKLYGGGKANTIGKVQAVYCPVGASNDPKGVNGHWRAGVMHYMRLIWPADIYVKA